MTKKKTVVVAIGGNALILSQEAQTIEDQNRALTLMVPHIVDLIESGCQVIVTYGNGPQVGFLLRRSEIATASTGLHSLPLVSCVANTEGGIGYQIQRAIKNEIARRGLSDDSVALLNQVVVDADDPGFANPTKPIGEFYTADRAEALRKENPSWVLKEDAGRGYRRYVPSPKPLEIVEESAIKTLLAAGFHLIAAGGGGIPVIRKNNQLQGVDAVIDKDLTSSLLATRINSTMFIICTGVPSVALHYGTPQQKNLGTITLAEAEKYMEEGHFAEGSMLPKIRAALQFVEATGNRAIITSPENLRAAVVEGKGTHIIP